MTPTLAWLLATLVLAGSMWIPYIVGVNTNPPPETDQFRRPHDGAHLPDWVRRADRAHMNLLEQGMPFAAVVLLADAVGATGTATAWAAAAFFALRVVHALGMISGAARFPLRPILFTSAWLCLLVVAWQAAFAGA